jgi:hypothetical protein
MTTLNSAIKEYLSENAQYNSNSKDSDLSLEEKSKILLEFINQDFINIYFQKINGNPYNIFNNNMFHIGSGTQGIVFSLYLKNLDFLNDIDGYNIKFCNESIANIKIACKIQLISLTLSINKENSKKLVLLFFIFFDLIFEIIYLAAVSFHSSNSLALSFS